MRDYILNLMRKSAYRPMNIKELLHHFNVPGEKKANFKKIIQQLTQSGEIILIKGKRYGLPKKMNLAVGRLSAHPDGFGFVSPEEGGEDIYVKTRGINTAMHGDKVVVRLEHFRHGERMEGRIIRILERARSLVVGRFEKFSSYGYLNPFDPHLTTDIYVPIKSSMEAETGDMAVAEIVNYASRNRNPEGKIVEILGQADDPGVDEAVVTRQYGLRHRFSQEVAREARDISQSVGENEFISRVDLRKKFTVTIDGETAKDFDDAISIEVSKKMTYSLWVHIADVSHYVRPGSAIDREAQERGTSVYFPGMVLPMLPEELSHGICSLNPEEDRLAFSVFMEFDRLGHMVRYDFLETVIKSSARMTYSQVRDILEGKPEDSLSLPAGSDDKFQLMKELAEKLRHNRMTKGSIDFDLPEAEVILDLRGRIQDIYRSERNVAHKIIEEFMLVANKTVAMNVAGQEVPFIYRVHEEPDPEKMDFFRKFVANFGYRLKSGKIKSVVLSRLVGNLEGRKEERLINGLLLRSMKQARYSALNIGHFGLAFDTYTHFTSPIRRYPDLTVHRLLKMLLKRGRYGPKVEAEMEKILPPLANHCSDRERLATEAEREIIRLKKIRFMKGKVGNEYEGFITGVTTFGFFVELCDFMVEGLVHVSSINDDYYVFSEDVQELSGEHTKKSFRVGDEVRVRVDNVNLERRRIDFSLIMPTAGQEGATVRPVRRKRPSGGENGAEGGT